MPRLVLSIWLLTLTGSVCAQNCPPDEDPATVAAPINHINFSNDGLLDQPTEDEIVRALRAHKVNPKSAPSEMSALADEGAEKVRQAYQNNGYFEAKVRGQAVRSSDASRYDINLQIGQVGKQYRLGELNIDKAAYFPTQQLRELFSMRHGEIFSRQRIVDGMIALRRLYGSQGYINFVAVPDTQFDEENATANLTVDVDEGKQFRLRSLKILGLKPAAKSQLADELGLRPGEIYTADTWDRVRQILPDRPDDPNLEQKRLDERDGFVDIILDFRSTRPCPAKPQTVPKANQF